MAARAGTPKPDVSTVEAFKQVLLKAKTVAVPGSTSGIWLTNDLFPRLGIAEKINVKAAPRGKDATGMVAAGGADLAVMPISEILHAPGRGLRGQHRVGDARFRSNQEERNGAAHGGALGRDWHEADKPTCLLFVRFPG